MARLDTQRPPMKLHARACVRPAVRGYYITPHMCWGDSLTLTQPPNKGAAKNGNVFIEEPTVTAQDGTNAAKLAGLGFTASPTSAWTSGQKITVGTFLFNWSGSAWAAGAHA